MSNKNPSSLRQTRIQFLVILLKMKESLLKSCINLSAKTKNKATSKTEFLLFSMMWVNWPNVCFSSFHTDVCGDTLAEYLESMISTLFVCSVSHNYHQPEVAFTSLAR